MTTANLVLGVTLSGVFALAGCVLFWADWKRRRICRLTPDWPTAVARIVYCTMRTKVRNLHNEASAEHALQVAYKYEVDARGVRGRRFASGLPRARDPNRIG